MYDSHVVEYPFRISVPLAWESYLAGRHGEKSSD